MNNETEIWKPIPNYDGLYEISNLGRVKRLKRIAEGGRVLREKNVSVYSPKKDDELYLCVNLSRDGVGTTMYISPVIDELFNHEPKKTIKQRIALWIIEQAKKHI